MTYWHSIINLHFAFRQVMKDSNSFMDIFLLLKKCVHSVFKQHIIFIILVSNIGFCFHLEVQFIVSYRNWLNIIPYTILDFKYSIISVTRLVWYFCLFLIKSNLSCIKQFRCSAHCKKIILSILYYKEHMYWRCQLILSDNM
jgi:hypothetical protein